MYAPRLNEMLTSKEFTGEDSSCTKVYYDVCLVKKLRNIQASIILCDHRMRFDQTLFKTNHSKINSDCCIDLYFRIQLYDDVNTNKDATGTHIYWHTFSKKTELHIHDSYHDAYKLTAELNRRSSWQTLSVECLSKERWLELNNTRVMYGHHDIPLVISEAESEIINSRASVGML